MNVPYFKINIDYTDAELKTLWFKFCKEHNYDPNKYHPKFGYLENDFENYQMTVIAELAFYIC